MVNLHPINCGKRQYTGRFLTVTTVLIIVREYGSCQNIAPLVEKFPGLYFNNIFLKADIEHCLNDVLHYSITSTPIFIFIQNGKEVDCLEDFNEEYMKKIIDKFSNDTLSKDIDDSIFAKAIAVGDLFQNILGRKGMDKILQCKMTDELDESQLSITNDRATILSKIDDDNQVVKVLIDISKFQYDEFGDGRTSVIVLATELLRQTKNLLAKRIHPKTIIKGWQKATNEALIVLEGIAKNNSSNLEHFKINLRSSSSKNPSRLEATSGAVCL